MAKEIEVVANTNWKAVKAGTKFLVSQEIHDILERKNYIGEVTPLPTLPTENPKRKK